MFPHNKAFASAVSAHSTTQQHLQHEEQAALLMAVLGEVISNNINPWYNTQFSSRGLSKEYPGGHKT